MIVAVPVVLMVEMAVYQVADVIAMGDWLVATAWTMYVIERWGRFEPYRQSIGGSA